MKQFWKKGLPTFFVLVMMMMSMLVGMRQMAPPSSYTVTYDGNTQDSGSVPTDSNSYNSGDTVTLLGKGTLVKAGYDFIGWSTALSWNPAATYSAGDAITMGSANVTLYAQWSESPSNTVIYNSNGADSRSVPVYDNYFTLGQPVNQLRLRIREQQEQEQQAEAMYPGIS